MTSNPKKGIFTRMIEIWKMWRLVCHFRCVRLTLANKLIEEKAKEKAQKYIVENTKKIALKQVQELKRQLTDNELDVIISSEKKEHEGFETYLAHKEASSYHKEATVNRNDFVDSYIRKFNGELITNYEAKGFEAKITDYGLREKKLDVNSVLESCLDKENAYIDKDADNSSYIYLTAKGKKFASLDGLLKEEITNGLGILWSLIGTAASVAIAVKWSTVGEIVVHLWSKV